MSFFKYLKCNILVVSVVTAKPKCQSVISFEGDARQFFLALYLNRFNFFRPPKIGSRIMKFEIQTRPMIFMYTLLT